MKALELMAWTSRPFSNRNFCSLMGKISIFCLGRGSAWFLVLSLASYFSEFDSSEFKSWDFVGNYAIIGIIFSLSAAFLAFILSKHRSPKRIDVIPPNRFHNWLKKKFPRTKRSLVYLERFGNFFVMTMILSIFLLGETLPYALYRMKFIDLMEMLG